MKILDVNVDDENNEYVSCSFYIFIIKLDMSPKWPDYGSFPEEIISFTVI